jgi:hypothetical protein
MSGEASTTEKTEQKQVEMIIKNAVRSCCCIIIMIDPWVEDMILCYYIYPEYLKIKILFSMLNHPFDIYFFNVRIIIRLTQPPVIY